MANVIIIEDDSRVISQYRKYIEELNPAHRLRVFSTSEEFHHVYLKNEQEPTGGSTHPLLQSFAPDQIEWLIGQNFIAAKPFTSSAAMIEIDPLGKLLKMDPETVKGGSFFEIPYAEFAKIDTINALVPDKLNGLWRQFISILKPDKVMSTAMPFVNPAGTAWLMKVSGKKLPNGNLQLVFRFQPEIFDPILATEKKLRQAATGEPEELQLLSTIDLIIFKTGNIKGPPLECLEFVHNKLQAGNFFPSDFRTRFIAIKYEDDGTVKTDLIHPYLDDLLYIPLDRLIFLQKLEIILGLPSQTRPSFLFLQEEKFEVELSKLTKLEKLSEVGCAIRNPVALSPGVAVRLKFRIPNEEGFITVLARSHRSMPHPNFPDEQLVFFYFFALDRDTLKKLKKFTLRHKSFRSLQDEDETAFEYSPDNIFLSEHEKKIKNIVVLDADPTSADQMAGLIREGIRHINVLTENSYYFFLKNILKDKSLQEAESPPVEGEAGSSDEIAVVKPTDLYAPEVSWTIATETQNLISSQTKATAEDMLLGFQAHQIFASNGGWRELFKGKDNVALLEETLNLMLSSDKKILRKFALTNVAGKPHWADVSFTRLAEPKGQILITISPVINTAWLKGDTDLISSIDLLVISEALVPANVVSWNEGIQSLALANGLTTPDRPFRIMIISDTKTNVESQKKHYRHTKIAAFIFKPLDARSLLFQISVILGAPFSKHNFDNQNYLEPNFNVHMTKEVTLDGISEFGASLTYPIAIEPGSVLFLHEGIFERAPNACLAAKFYHCEPSQTEKGMFSCSFLYYGINDAFLKFCRSWIRDTYASKKSNEN